MSSKQDELKKELILKEIDQLENAISSFSNSTTWVKKSGGPVIAAIISIAVNKNVPAMQTLAVIFMYTFISWVVDSFCYFFQKKLRYVMSQKFMMLDSRWPYSKEAVVRESIPKALFNGSHALYYIMFVIELIFCVVYKILEANACACPCCQM